MPSRTRPVVSIAIAALTAGVLPSAVHGQGAAYSPYADSRQLAPDGTIRWGTFYKTAAIQQKCEYLWNIGARRGTAPDIVATVSANKLDVDALPETEFIGTARGAAGGLACGVVSFVEAGKAGKDEPPLVAQVKKGTLVVRVNAGRIRSLSIPLADDAVATIDVTVPELAAAGDGLAPFMAPACPASPSDRKFESTRGRW